MLDQAESLRNLVKEKTSPRKKAKIITVTSGKGGVGKSNFVVNLGITLQKQGNKVLIFDADIGMGNDDVLMGVYPKNSFFDILKGKDFSEIIVEGPYGINLLPGGSGLNQIEDLGETERSIFLSKLESLDGYDYILMDTGAGINRSVLAFIASSEELIVLTTPEPTSLTDAYSLIKATSHFKIRSSAKVVINRAFDEKEGEQTYLKFKRAVDRFLKMELSYLGCILEDRKLVKSVREQKPFVLAYPNSDAARCINSIANKIQGNSNESNVGAQGLFKKLFNIFS